MGNPHEGDPAFGERHFVDQKPWLPPRYQPASETGDPFWKPAPDLADKSIEEALSTPAGVATPNVEPGASEFSHGRGQMPPLALGPDPSPFEQYHAVMRTNPADPTASHIDRYADWIRE